MTLTILISIYILSFLRMYFWNRNAHSKGGVFQHSNPNPMDLFYTVVPLANTISAILCTAHSLTGKKQQIRQKKPLDFSKFFNVKK